MTLMEKFIVNIARNWIRKMMFEHKLSVVFKLIHEEYSRVYYEDNVMTRQSFLHELVDSECPADIKIFYDEFNKGTQTS